MRIDNYFQYSRGNYWYKKLVEKKPIKIFLKDKYRLMLIIGFRNALIRFMKDIKSERDLHMRYKFLQKIQTSQIHNHHCNVVTRTLAGKRQ